ncbi:hypothetical protein [Pseudoalteromonas tunicata]|jgi:hypothetical protein|uniref:Uncharacterized protein n=1 Tax=Pseudoalteromonas tunicata D2 TaxID=87626 RepID=A4C3B6_9GAMM|nr:hypothetical protein [Pseudoalteromonas tunicata]ATC96671.1 hypothetical protein PTUN_b0247 [Pseudoalteromonas tunicata]EAR30048.1 hypothetical protein PTD2_00726 [Pseudoalteromonas tunicata D2]MDP4983791.1 hypothetical protein [Pseudoalteromonas tunicata]MDP5214695.1 hypothetical protein [Pseudoalteromonas tunicata]
MDLPLLSVLNSHLETAQQYLIVIEFDGYGTNKKAPCGYGAECLQ